jgi:DNA-binding CsgD family transcriptional regulator
MLSYWQDIETSAFIIMTSANMFDPHLAERALNLLSVGVLLLTSDRRIAFANRIAQDLLDRGDIIRSLGGRLVGSDNLPEAELAGVISRAAYQAGVQGLRLDRGIGRPPIQILGMPLRPVPGSPPVATPQTNVMVVVVDPEVSTAPSIETLKALYGLTAAEAHLAQRLLRGERLEECARHAGISVNTARTHLKAVFAKTDTNRQTDLIRLLSWTLLDATEESTVSHRNE